MTAHSSSAAPTPATSAEADFSGGRAGPPAGLPTRSPRKARRRWRGLLLLVVLLLVLFAIAAVWGNRPHVPQRAPQTVHLTPQQLAQGQYLVRAADCMACHDGGSGEPFAGGKPLPTPFGTLYGTNISSHPDQGIGRWTADEFHGAVTRGTGPGGRQLYPAMPYTSYHQMSREDSDLIYGYLMHTRPIAQANRQPDLPLPFNLRVLMFGWKTLFLSSAPLPTGSQGQSPAWLRGQYLGNVMGHCAECHTPRGMFGQMDKGRWLQGGTLSLFSAPGITAEALAARGWTSEGMARFLQSGFSAHGSAFDEMHEVITNSTQHFTGEDIAALTTFLLGDTPPAPRAVQPLAAATGPGADTGALAAGLGHYMALCASCHGSEGLGRSLTMPPLLGNSTVRQADARNLVLAILVGLPKHPATRQGPTPLPGMPGFMRELDDAEVANLANYTRAALGGLPADVTPAQVAGLRSAAVKAGHQAAP